MLPMKSTYLTFLLAIIAVTPILAQPVIDNSTMPPIGASIEFFHSAFESPTAPGPNQIWNFNPQVNEANTKRVVAPSTAPAGSLINGADIALTQSQSALVLFYAANNQRIGFAGVRYSSTFRINYNGSMLMWPLPIAYNDTFSEALTATYVRSDVTYHRKGLITGKAEAWGELTTMWRTYDTVLRLRVETLIIDSSFQNGAPVFDTITNQAHYYLKNDIALYLFSHVTGRDHRGDPIDQMIFQNPVTANVAEIPKDKGYQLFPNPATDHIVLRQTVQVPGQSQYAILSVTGQTIHTGTLTQGEATISVAHLPKGVYLLRVEGRGSVAALPFVKQ